MWTMRWTIKEGERLSLYRKAYKDDTNRRIQNIIHTRNRIKAIDMLLYTEEAGVFNVEAQMSTLEDKNPTPHPYHPPSVAAPS